MSSSTPEEIKGATFLMSVAIYDNISCLSPDKDF